MAVVEPSGAEIKMASSDIAKGMEALGDAETIEDS